MAYRLQNYPQPSLTTFTAGQRSMSRILSGKLNAWYTFVITATVTVAGGAVTGLLNRGNLAGIFQYVGVDENGYDAAQIDARMATFLTSLTAANLPPDITLPDAAANGVYNLRTTIRLPFAWVLGMKPFETAHVERDPSQDTNTFVTPWAGYAGSAIGFLCLAPGTAAITNLNVNCYQHFDEIDPQNLPVFVPRYRMQSFTVTGANADEPIYVRSAVALRGLIVGQNTTGRGNQTDIVNSMAHRDSLRDYIGPRKANFQDLTALQQLEYGGRVAAQSAVGVAGAAVPGFPFYFVNYQALGKLSNIWTPVNGGQDLRFETSVQPSVVAGAGTSNFDTCVMELLKIANRTKAADFPY